MRCPTHIACNRLDLVLTGAPDMLDVLVGVLHWALQTSACQLCGEQSL